MSLSPNSSSRSLKSLLREVERESGSGAYAAILRERLTDEDLARMQMQLDEASDLARRQQEHAPREVRGD